MKSSKVLIARYGGFEKLGAEAGDYDPLIQSITNLATLESRKGGVEIEVRVFADNESLKSEIRKIPVNESTTVVFLTRGVLEEARVMKQVLNTVGKKDIRIVLLTGSFPREEIILLDKWWLDANLIRRAIF